MSITNKDLISTVAAATGETKASIGRTLDAITKAISDGLQADGEVNITGLGKLKLHERKARTCRNPQTGEQVEVDAKTVVKFVAAKSLRDAVN